jgi:hypothetical protein
MGTLRLGKREIQAEEIESYLLVKGPMEVMEQKLRQLRLQLEKVTSSIICQLESGATSPDYNLCIKEQSRVVVSWKKEFTRANGERAVNEIIASTKPSITKKLIIQESHEG